MIKNRDLGDFSSIQEVWRAYPYGGAEGDYLRINGVEHQWNKYDRIWENSNTTTEGTAIIDKVVQSHLILENGIEVVSGDAVFKEGVRVKGVLTADKLKQPNKGLFPSIELLRQAYPHPQVGDWAIVGNTVPGRIWRCNKENIWTDTGQTGGLDPVDLTAYLTTADTSDTTEYDNVFN